MSSRTLPGSSGLPLVGENIPFLRDIKRFLDDRLRQHGPVFRTHILGAPTAFTCSYASSLSLLHTASPMIDAAPAYAEFMATLYPSPNLLLAKDTDPLRVIAHRHLRAVLQTPLQNHVITIRRVAHANIVALPERPLRPYAFFKSLTERLVTTVVLGHLTQEQYRHIRLLCSRHFNGIVAAPIHVDVFGTRSARAAAVDAQARLTEAIIHRLRIIPNATDCSALAILARQVNSQELSLDQATQLLLVLLSTAIPKALASALANVMRALAASKQLQDSVLREDVQTKDDGETPVLDGLLMEILRLFPPLPGGIRQAGDRGATVDGWRVPRSWRVWFSMLHANRDETVYTNAKKFLPERWRGSTTNTVGCPFAKAGDTDGRMDEEKGVATPLSFGAGERHCKGRDLAWVVMRECVLEILRRFEVHLVDGSSGAQLDGDAAAMRLVPVLRSIADEEIALRRRVGSE